MELETWNSELGTRNTEDRVADDAERERGKEMKKTLILAGAAAVLIGISLLYFFYFQSIERSTKAQQERTAKQTETIAVVAPGVVEPISEEIEVGAEIPGKLKEVRVDEGDRVLKGEIIAVLENSDFAAAVERARTRIGTLVRQKETARARLESTRADRVRIFNGSRREERVEAKRAYEQTLPGVAQARSELERREKLYRSGDISREELERARRSADTVRKESLTRRETYNVVNADPRRDDLAKADTSIRLAEAQLKEFDGLIAEARSEVKTAEASLSKTIIRAPITGVILRKRMKDGESVSPEASFGIVTVADDSALRVRVDVDETDIAKVKDGGEAYVTADAFGKKRFTGRVVRIGKILGRKNLRTERPREKVDTKILEVLIELDSGQNLPMGLRVDAYFETD